MSKIYVKSDWNKVCVYIINVDDYPGKILSKNSDGFYELDVTGNESKNVLINDGNGSQSSVLAISSLVGKVYDTATATISDYPSIERTQKFVTVNNLKRFLKNVDDRYYTESEVDNLLSGKSNTDHTHSYISTSASCNKNWNWSGQGGQPSWLWGGEDGTNMYIYNPSNFSVNYANSAGSAGYATEAGHGNLLATYADDGHYLCPDRYDGWNTRLYMTYGDKGVKANNVHVYYSDISGSANSATYASRSANDGGFYINGYLVTIE